jgi:hypothetical protein
MMEYIAKICTAVISQSSNALVYDVMALPSCEYIAASNKPQGVGC